MLSDSMKTAKNKLQHMMLAEQLKAAKCQKQGMKWHPEIIKWAAYVYHKSASAYDEINSSGFIRLPSRSTIQRLTVNFTHETGFNDHILKDMRNAMQLENLPEHKKYVVLKFDEMSIHSDILYNKHK